MNVDTFLEQFGHLADAPDGIKKLRELILKLAVQGKLSSTKQDDESSNLLLKRIINDGSKLLPEKVKNSFSKNELKASLDFQIPESWQIVFLGQVTLISTGFAFKSKDYADDGIFVLRVTNINPDGNIIKNNSVFISPELLSEKYEKYLLDVNDILVVMVGGSLGKIGLVTENILPALLNQNMWRVKNIGDDFYNSKYLRLVLEFVNRFQLKITASTHGHMSLREYRMQPIPLPPLAEQKRIVAKVDELMTLCDELETQQQQRQTVHAQLTTASLHQLTTAETPRQLTKAWQRIDLQFDQLFTTRESIEKLRQTILQLAVQGKLVPQDPEDEPAEKLLERIEAVGRVTTDTDPIDANEIPFNIPTSWEWSRANILFDVAGGITKNSKRVPKENHFPYLRVANVQRDSLVLDQIERFELFDGELERWKLVPNDLLIVEGNGSEKEIGRCAIWNGEINNCVHQNHLIRCRPQRNVEAKFSLIFFNSPSGMNVMKDKAITTSGLYSLSVGKVRSLVVPLPPREEQKRIVAKVNQLMAICDQLEHNLENQEATTVDLAASMTTSLLNVK
ncbi:MAG: restriction endonuclease subunit S [Gimesia sp.]|nr:restriction endonuclease subunit S [Gimesia sp.]